MIRLFHIALGFCLFFPPGVAAQTCPASQCTYTGPTEIKAGDLVVPSIRVLLHNVEGQGDRSDSACERRLTQTGRRIATARPAYDIVGLNEVHPDYFWARTCNGKKLVTSAQTNGDYGTGRNRWGHPETRWHSYDGGLALLSQTPFEWTPYSRQVHEYSWNPRSRTAAGFLFAQIGLAGGQFLDVYVTHLHSTSSWPAKCDQACRRKELKELADGIHERSATSGNPVLVMGDFNIDGPAGGPCSNNCGYGDIMELLRDPVDVWILANPTLPGLTHDNRRIDYMFILTDPHFTSSDMILTLAPNVPVDVVKWQMPDGSAVSDHFGIDAMFELRRPPRPSGGLPGSTTQAPAQSPNILVSPNDN